MTVNDGRRANNTVERTFLVTVNAVNDPPTLDAIRTVTINEDAGLQTVDLAGSPRAGREPGQTLTVNATPRTRADPGPAVSTPAQSATGSLSFTPAANANGTATITVTVDDGQA